MLNPELWSEGLITMVVGMGIVFSFLIILVFAIHIMVKIVRIVDKFCPVIEPENKTNKKQKQTDDTEVALAIAVSLNR